MLNDGFQAAIFFLEEPSGCLTQILLKGRQLGTPAWTAQHPPYAHGAHTGNSHLVQVHIHTLSLALMHTQHTRAHAHVRMRFVNMQASALT